MSADDYNYPPESGLDAAVAHVFQTWYLAVPAYLVLTVSALALAYFIVLGAEDPNRLFRLLDNMRPSVRRDNRARDLRYRRMRAADEIDRLHAELGLPLLDWRHDDEERWRELSER